MYVAARGVGFPGQPKAADEMTACAHTRGVERRELALERCRAIVARLLQAGIGPGVSHQCE